MLNALFWYENGCLWQVISQGSVATRLRCGGQCDSHFVANFLMNSTTEKFRKSVNICQSCGQKYRGPFFWLTVYIGTVYNRYCSVIAYICTRRNFSRGALRRRIGTENVTWDGENLILYTTSDWGVWRSVMSSPSRSTVKPRPKMNLPHFQPHRTLKMRDWNYRHHQKCRGGKCRTGNIGTMLQGVENAGLELSAPTCSGGKCGTKQLWKAKHLLVTAHTTWSI